MKIEILGTGCAKCKKLTEVVEQIVQENSLNAEVVKVTEIDKIMEYGVMFTPALVINGEVKVSGRIPSKEEVLKWIRK